MPRSIVIDYGLEGTTDGGTFDVCVMTKGDPAQRALGEAIGPGQTITADFDIAEIHFLARDGGYWGLSIDAPPSTVSGVIPRLPNGPAGWWHEAHGLAAVDDKLGEGIRIGIIDEALSIADSNSPIAHIVNLRGEAWDVDAPRAITPETSHSMAICGLVAARPVQSGQFHGIAPGAEVFFAAAGEDQSERLNVARLSNAIDLLVNDYECDIISFSAGDCEAPVPEIEAAVAAAQDAGCVCFVAAGNSGGNALYPARYAECLAVGAVGKLGLAPANTFESLQEQLSSATVADGYFLWCHSAQGPEVDYVGSGLAIAALQQSGVYSVCGTSYAAPITAGLAAIILSQDSGFTSLPRDSRRAKYAIEVINCSTERIFPEFCGQGMVKVKM